MTEGPMTYDAPGLDARLDEEALPDEPAAPRPVPSAEEPETAFDLLRQKVQTRVARAPIRLPVLELPGCEVVYDVNIEWELLQAWRRAAQDPETGIPDALRVSLTVLTNQCREIRFNGHAVRRGGRLCTFVHSDIQELVEASDAAHAARRLYGNDAHVILAGDGIIAAAGYADRLVREAADPSETSSGH